MNLSVTARWILLALAGLLVALAVAVAASKLTSQRIGLASEPLQAGQDLAPAQSQADQAAGGRGHHGGRGNAADQGGTSPSLPPTASIPSTSPGSTPSPTAPDDRSQGESTEVEGADD